MNLTILVFHESDERASEIIETLGGQVASERLAPFASVSISPGELEDFHIWECDWWHSGSRADRRTVPSLLADIGALKNLRIVALATSVDRGVALALSDAHEELERGCRDAFAGASTRISTARVGVAGRQEVRPHALYFSPLADHNLLVLPYDRFDDAMAADSVTSDDRERFATHGAVDVGALCGLWAPMTVAPIDRGAIGGDGERMFGIRLVQSRVRSLHAPTASIHELFGEQHEALPVPNRCVKVTNLTSEQIDELAEALVADVEGLHVPRYEQEDYALDEKNIRKLFGNVAVAAIKESPAAIAALVRGEVNTIIRLALQEIVAPDGSVKVTAMGVGAQLLNGADANALDPFHLARLKDELAVIPPAVWSALVDRILATIGGDPSADEIRSVVLGGPDRVPTSKRDLLDGLETLPGNLPRLALGDDSVTLLGSARVAELAAPERFSVALPSDDLHDDLVKNWESFLEALRELDEQVADVVATTSPFDWSGNVLTMLLSDATNTRATQKLERLDAEVMIKDALLAAVGAAPVLVNWIGSPDEFRAMVVAESGDHRQSANGRSSSSKQGRSGLLMRIGERILEERDRALDDYREMTERLANIESGEFVHRVQPAIYALMALGFAGVLFEFLTSPIGERLLALIPDNAGTGALYVPVVVGLLFGAGLLTNVGLSLGGQVRFVVVLAAWVFTTGLVVLFGLAWTPQLLTVAHIVIGVLILLAGYQAASEGDEFRSRLVRLSGVLYGFVVVVLLALLSNRGAGPLARISDPQTLLRIGTLIQWTSRALLVGGFIVLIVNRGRARVQLERELRDIEWLGREAERAAEAVETLSVGYVQWYLTACSLAQVIRQPYGPLVTAVKSPEAARLEGIRRASFAELNLTTRGSELLRNELRQELVPPGWLKQRYEVRVEEFLRLEAEQQRTTLADVRESRPETDPAVASPDEIEGRSAIRSKRLLFADRGHRGAFDAVSSAPIADESLLGLLDPVLRNPDAQRINGGPAGLVTAFDFLVQAGPSSPGPIVPTDEVLEFERRRVAVERRMQQLLWWPRFFPSPREDDGLRVEETSIRWIGGGPSKGSTAVQLLAVRVDYSPLYEYATLRFGIDDEQAAEPREIFDRPSDGGIIG